jgi:hypothetical protein
MIFIGELGQGRCRSMRDETFSLVAQKFSGSLPGSLSGISVARRLA